MGIMALSELSLHNTIRTDDRQQQTGWALRVSGASTSSQPPQDRLALSNEARNLQQIRRVAAELVSRLHRHLSPLEQLSLATALEQEVRIRYADQLEGELLPADVLKGWLRSLKVAGAGG
jgi:hypothetical protein